MGSIVRHLALLLALLPLALGFVGIADSDADGLGSRLGPAAPAPGDLDTAFGGDGKVTTDLTRHGGLANAVAIQADGKIVAAGHSLGPKPKFALARFRVNGTLNITFGGDGTVTTTIGGDGAVANAVAIQGDGKIVAAGQSFGSNPEFALARYNGDGTLDTTFGTDGKVTTDFTGVGDLATAVAIQADGKIVAAGATDSGVLGEDFALARYNADGTLDTTFGTDGKVTTDFTGVGDVARAVAIQADGKIVAAGTGSGSPELARYDPAGTLDPTFGNEGRVVTDFSGFASFLAYAVAIQADGKIVAAGEHFECFIDGCESGFLLLRYNTDGSLDTTFGGDGVTGGFPGWANAVAIQVDGRIVAAGEWLNPPNDPRFAVLRYKTDGTLDQSFGKHGWVLTDFTRGTDVAQGVAIQADGKIVAAGGSAVFGPNPKFALARYLS